MHSKGVISTKLYIKQKVFSWGDKFTVKDSSGLDRYFVEGEVFSFGKKLHVYTPQHKEVAYIEQKLLTWMPRYSVFLGDQEVAQMVREFSFFHPRYRIEGLGWDVEGAFWEHEYEISQAGRLVASIHKEWMTWGDSYELDITDADDEILALATILAIDAVVESQKN